MLAEREPAQQRHARGERLPIFSSKVAVPPLLVLPVPARPPRPLVSLALGQPQ